MANTGGARAPKKRKGQGHIGPDGARYQRSTGPFNSGNTHGTPRIKRPGGGKLRDTGKGLRGTRRQRENPRPERLSFGGQNRNRPQRPSQPRGGPSGPPRTPLVDALTELQYGGQLRQLDSERRISDQAMANTGNWYQQYQQQVQQAAAQQAAYTQGFQQAAFQQANTAATTDQGQNQQLLQQQQASAAQRGTTVDPSVAQTLQGGVAARQVAGAAGGNLLAQQGQAQGAYLANRVGVAGAQGIQAQQDEQRKRQQIEQLSRDLQKEVGAFQSKTKMDLRQQRHKNRLENKAFGLDVAQEQFDQADALADNQRMSASERRQQREARSRIRDRRHDNRLADSKEQRIRDQDLADDGKLNSSSGGSSKGNFTPTQVRDGRRSLRNLVGRIKSNVDPPDSVDPLLARAAVQIADNGGVSPALARKIKRQYGFTPKIKRTGWKKKALDEGKRGAAELF